MLGALKFDTVMKRVFGSSNDRRLKGYRPMVVAINALEPEFEALTDEQLRAKTEELRAEFKAGKTLDDLIPPSFAAVREAAKRTLKQRHFDVQLMGGLVLHEGAIAEMRTGEGKTLVATTAVYLNALAGEGVHVVTVNDYLARRNSEWMGQIYQFLGMNVGVIVHGLDDDQRRQAYAADVTYGTNNEFGFDYLRDNMKYDMAQMVQRATLLRLSTKWIRSWLTRRGRRSSSQAPQKTAPVFTFRSTRSFPNSLARNSSSMRSNAQST